MVNKLKNIYIKYFVKGAYAGSYDANRIQLFEQKAEFLRYHTLHSNEVGITDELLCDSEVVVSLTTFGRRFFDVYLAVESIMQGSVKPNRIILWLQDELKSKALPITLKRQISRGLEVRYTKDIKSYKKLIPTVMLYPDATIITIDDDQIYNFDFVENLINAHKETPDCIIGNRVHRIVKGSKNTISSYNKWKFGRGYHIASKLNFATGGGGILYPPHSLSHRVFEENLFMLLAPKADDVWFYAMAILNGTKIRRAYTRSENGEEYLQNESMQDEALNHTNVAENGNDSQIAAVFTKFGIYELLKSEEE